MQEVIIYTKHICNENCDIYYTCSDTIEKLHFNSLEGDTILDKIADPNDIVIKDNTIRIVANLSNGISTRNIVSRTQNGFTARKIVKNIASMLQNNCIYTSNPIIHTFCKKCDYYKKETVEYG